MAVAVWTELDKIWCDRAQEDVVLQEKRVFPTGFLRQASEFRVAARHCSQALQCNMAGYPCKWAFTNPDYDPVDLI